VPNATYEEGTELVLNSENIVPGATWSDQATAGSEVFRSGPRVSLNLRVTPKARAAWEKQVYEKGALALEGGHVFEAVVAETDELEPTENPVAWSAKKWKKGERVTFLGRVLEAIPAETTEAENPTEKPAEWKDLGAEGFQWKDLGTEAANEVICTLPVEYRPAATVKDATSATVEVDAEGHVIALDEMVAATPRVYSLSYRAAGVSP
jgi:hypothetical protein